MRRTVAIAFLAFCSVAVALAQDAGSASANKTNAAVEQQIKQMEQQVRSGVIKGETSAMERFLSDDFVNIVGNGMMFDKNQSIQMLKDGTVKYTAIDLKEEKVRVYGDTAIYNGLASIKMTAMGQDLSGDYRVTIVWAKLKGQWRRVSFQTTPVRSQ